MTDATAVQRRVGRRTAAGGEANTVVISRRYETTVEDLWDACTNPERLPRWFLPVTGTLALGGHYQLQGNAGGTVEACDPPRGFTATWEYGGDVSWIEVRLTPEAGGTRLEIEHIATDEEKWRQFGPGAVGIGWELALDGLGRHLAGADPRPPQTAPAEREQNLRARCEQWAQAQVASGAEPAQAADAARRTGDFYLGFAGEPAS